MRKMIDYGRRFLTAALSMVLMTGALAGCGESGTSQSSGTQTQSSSSAGSSGSSGSE